MCGGQLLDVCSFFYCVGSWDQTHVIRLGSRCLYSLNHITVPLLQKRSIIINYVCLYRYVHLSEGAEGQDALELELQAAMNG